MLLTLAPPVLEGLSLRLTMKLRIGRTLEQELITENTGSQPAVFTQALHNYFNVSDALKVDVAGLDGLTYLDKLDAGNAHVQQGDWNLRDPRDPGRSDRIYTQARGHYVLRDPGFGRSIDITTQGSRSAVVWNAGEAAAAKMDDIGAGWRNYVCVEAGNVGPDLGQSYIIDSFLVVVLGGVGQLAGTVYAALGLGVLNKFIEGWAGAVLAKIAVLVFIIIFIQKRPQGIFAIKGRSAEA